MVNEALTATTHAMQTIMGHEHIQAGYGLYAHSRGCLWHSPELGRMKAMKKPNKPRISRLQPWRVSKIF